MKTFALIVAVIPLLAFSQSKSDVKIYYGNGSFEKRIIDQSNCKLSRFPTLDLYVEVLILDNNNIKELPDRIANLRNLRSLSIRNNQLTNVDILQYCENLEELYLTGNENLSNLPSFTACKKLRIIDVVHTKINYLPVSIRGHESIGYFKYSEK